jgi:tetratricopeptide (TPR) repeat protein
MRQGQPSKALVLLQRARSLDSLQLDIDRMMNQCRAKLGGWVAPDAGSEWSEVDGQMDRAIHDKPDSMFQVGKSLAASEDIPGALRIYLLLSRNNAANPIYMKAYTDLRARQDTTVAFHRDLAEQAAMRGETSECLAQWRLAFAARPDDIGLQQKVEQADRAYQMSLGNFRLELQRCLSGRDDLCALEVLAKALVANPADPGFLKAEDSLQVRRRELFAAKLDRIDAMADSGEDQAAMEAMEAMNGLYPGEQALAQAQNALQDRIRRRRMRDLVDSVTRAFDFALREGDVQGAEAMIGDLRARGVAGGNLDKLRGKIDSVHAKARNSAAFNEALSTARRLLSKGDTASARVSLRRMLALQPENALAKWLLASLNATRHVPKPVVSNPAKPVQTASIDSDALKRVNDLVLAGISAYRTGEYKNAMEKWQQALALDPKCVQAQRYLANVGRMQARLQ